MKKTIAFLLKGYPRVSETFIAQEIYMLEQKGFQIEIFSMRQARESQRQPIVAMIKSPVTYIPEYIFSRDFFSLVAGNLRTFLRVPLRYLASLGESLGKSIYYWDDSPVKRHLQAGWLIARKLGPKSSVAHLHSHFAHAPTELAYYTSRMTGLRFTISAHAKDIYTIPQPELRRRINASEMIMTCTEYNYDFMRALSGVQKDKINKVYHGINLQNFKPFRSSQNLSSAELSRFLSVGRLVAKKGYDDIFAALRILKDKGHEFTYDIYGTGNLKKDLQSLARDLGLDQQIVFHGTTTHPEIIERMNNKGIFICGSKLGEDGDRDGIPNTLAEAMAMELPVIATQVSGIPELIEDKVSGLLVPGGDPSALAAGIEYLMQNPQESSRMALAGRERIARVFNSEIWIDRCARLLAPFAGMSQ